MSTITVVAPRSIEEAAEAVRHAARERAVVLATGGNTKRTWTKPAARVDVELSTRHLSGVVAYEPGDGVITALAGTPWAELEALVARNGHHLSPAIPSPRGSTVGGVVAAGQSGIDRLRYGPLRDHVLGLRVVMADGSVAKTGGRLVKNVTGFDLHRLHTGAHGTLGLVAEVSLRLQAAPQLRAIGVGSFDDVGPALDSARAVSRIARTTWSSLVREFDPPNASPRWQVFATLGGSAAAVEADTRALLSVRPELTWLAETSAPDAARVDGLWGRAIGYELDRGSWRSVRVTCTPSRVDSLCAVLATCAGELGLATNLVVDPAVGSIDAAIRPLGRDVVAVIAADLRRAGARVHWRGLDDELRARVDLDGGEEPAGLALMRRIRANLDPHGLWASGRLAGGL